MRFLTVADRELRAAARRPATYRARWITAAVFFVLLVWLAWVSGWFYTRRATPDLFQAFSIMVFFYSLIVVTGRTADCLSVEKREGTLGLLFLTNLNSAEILAGKVCANALSAVYGLVAIFPLLGLLLLAGGVTAGCFWRTVLALVNGIFFAVAAGFLASSLSVKHFKAVSFAAGLGLLFTLFWPGLGVALDEWFRVRVWADTLSVWSPLGSLILAQEKAGLAQQHYWLSLAGVAGVSLSWLALATWQLAHSWRDRPKAARSWGKAKVWQRWRERSRTNRSGLRRRLLEINPFLWLDSRGHIGAPGFMILTVLVVAVSLLVAVPATQTAMSRGGTELVGAFVLIWFFTGITLHALVLYYAAMIASQRLAEDKQTGALELILSTPLSEPSISRGLWLAFGRRMFFPALVATLAHLFFIWLGAMFLVMVAPTELPRNITAGQLLWAAFLNQFSLGQELDWSFGIALRIFLLALVMFAVIWVTLGWVGRWLGLRMKHPGFVPLVTLAGVLLPPTGVFSVVCYECDELGLLRLPDRQIVPIMVWVAFGLGVGHCLWLSLWARGHLRRDFRTVVTSRYQPPSSWLDWRAGLRMVWRLTLRAAAAGAALVLVVVLFYGYHNWHSRHAWLAFQRELSRVGGSLQHPDFVPAPVPDALNFARLPVFQRQMTNRHSNTEPTTLLTRLNRYGVNYVGQGNSPEGIEWLDQLQTPLASRLAWLAPTAKANAQTNRAEAAAALLQALRPQEDLLRTLATGARRPAFQVDTNRMRPGALSAGREEGSALDNLQALFQIRACALLTTDRPELAGEDVMTSLRLASLARQVTDLRSFKREQVMVTRSLQPVWEGICSHQWQEAQLAEFQEALAGFNLLADYTNAVRRATLAYIGVWRTIPESPTERRNRPRITGSDWEERAWQLQPRGWWYDHCIRLYQAGTKAIEKVDVAGGHVRLDPDQSDINGLPLDGDTSTLLQQRYWDPKVTQVAFVQDAVNQGILACALERWRLVHGNYPATLDQLTPDVIQRIPNDVARGQPLLYQRLDDGRFILRSVGPNGKDDRKQAYSDDWLWAFPTNTPAANQ